MAAFGGMTLTNKGLALQGKAQAGTPLNYTRIAVGDGSLSGQSIPALNNLISPKKSLPVTRLQIQPSNKAVIGTVLRNAEMSSGFYFREVGVFAQDPDAEEILYAYANAGTSAEYIAPGGGSDVIEKAFNCIVAVGTAANVTAVIDESLVFARESEFTAHRTAAELDHPDGSVTAAKLAPAAATDTVIGSRTVSDLNAPTGDTGTLTGIIGWLASMVKAVTGKSSWRTPPATTLEAASGHMRDTTAHVTAAERGAWNTKETTGGAQAKADAAQAAAIAAAAADASTKANAAAASSVPAAQKGTPNGVATLDGTTRLPVAQLPVSVPQQTTQELNLYVRTDGNDNNNGLVNTSEGAFRTINRAIAAIPPIAGHNVTITILSGSYTEDVLITGKSGGGLINFAISGSGTIVVNSFTAIRCASHILVNNFSASTTVTNGFGAYTCSAVNFINCSAITSALSYSGFIADVASVYMNGCTASNKKYGILASYNARIITINNTGTGNTYGVYADGGGSVTKYGSQPAGSTPEGLGNGVVTSGVLNPWGDNTQSNRPILWAYGNMNQPISSTVWTNVIFGAGSTVQNLSFNSSSGRATIQQAGWYKVKVKVLLSSVPGNCQGQLRAILNDSQSHQLDLKIQPIQYNMLLQGDVLLYCGVGDRIDIQAYCDSNTTITAGTALSTYEIVRVA
ncbi:hypothetical protein F4V43_11335 [Paenibacillus spiritus]|uniref:Phage tail fibre protein N-terminal domain-containing protein n=1 Tax=Paenibacillus spiritus TaxID=2496557 RepID=A0A5J5G8E0_9BACL|nr:phage tail protein [Paenibacillus spiritus]KAA9003996.1 hypothetical protein F4V43_11335 [Paenibacillus spiritus]